VTSASRWLAAVVAAVSIAVGAACSPQGAPGTTREWTEDVLLDDGTTIQVERTVRFKETDAPGGGAYNAIEQDATIAFTGELAQLPTWQQPLMAMVLYHDHAADEWVVVARTSSCFLWEDRGKPKPPYFEFRLGKDGWHETPLSPASFGRPTNLLLQYRRPLPAKQITVAERRRIDSDGVAGRAYREIWAEPDQHYCGEGHLRK
jgi:hypothetical protein